MTDRQLKLAPAETEDYQDKATQHLQEAEQRRQRVSLSRVQLMANGYDEKLIVNNSPQAAVALSPGSMVDFTIEADTQLLKVVATDAAGELPVAVLMLQHREIINSLEYRLLGRKTVLIDLDETRQLRFTISLSASAAEGHYAISAHYRETSPAGQLLPGPVTAILNSFAFSRAIMLIVLIGLLVGGAITSRRLLPGEPPVTKPSSHQPSRGGAGSGQPELAKSPINRSDEKVNKLVAVYQFDPAANIRKLSIAEDVATLQIRLALAGRSPIGQTSTGQLPAGKYQAMILLRGAQLSSVWRSDIITAAGDGQQLLIDIPARIFIDGDYQLSLKPVEHNHSGESLDLLFTVERLPAR